MKPISLTEAKKYLESGEVIFIARNDVLNQIHGERYNNKIKNILKMIGEFSYNPNYYSYSNSFKGETISPFNITYKFYKLDETKNIYNFCVIDEDGRLSKTNIMYYKRYNDMVQIFNKLADKFVLEKIGKSIDELKNNNNHTVRYDSDGLYISDNKHYHIHICSDNLFLKIYKYPNGPLSEIQYGIGFKLCNLLEGE